MPQSPSGGTGASGGDEAAQATALRTIGQRTFILENGAWVDTTFDPQVTAVQQVVFLSEDYFRLLSTRPDLSAPFALGDKVTVVVDGQAYQVVQEGQSVKPLTLPSPQPPTLTPMAPGVTPGVTLEPVRSTPLSGSPTPVIPPTKAAGRSTVCLGLFVPLGMVIAAAFLIRRRK